ncbi:MAG: glycine cleavage system aminomethyltransferase GcvT [Chloroflexota bacterium]|nr:MAG: glycine cleavage system aminomethyltransferase GcvT [Chloroflexota bacterium]
MEDTTSSGLRRSPLLPLELAAGARLIEFGGWELPLQYTGVVQEHRAVRSHAGLFDVSHLGLIQVEGVDAVPFLQSLLTNDIAQLLLGDAQYTLLCNEAGGILDDLVVLRLAPERYWLVVNAATHQRDWDWLTTQMRSQPRLVDLMDLSNATVRLALQGPASAGILQQLSLFQVSDLGRLRVTEGVVCGGIAVVSRTGYTGEDGFEIVASSDQGTRIWEALLAQGVAPCGLGARDTLRLEASLLLYGQDMDSTTNPIEAGLRPFVKLNKGPFIGRDAIQRVAAQGPSKKLVCFRMLERAVPRHGYPIAIGSKITGYVTSGNFGPSVNAYIGMGYVPSHAAAVGTEIDVIVREKAARAVVVKKPFYRAAIP